MNSGSWQNWQRMRKGGGSNARAGTRALNFKVPSRFYYNPCAQVLFRSEDVLRTDRFSPVNAETAACIWPGALQSNVLQPPASPVSVRGNRLWRTRDKAREIAHRLKRRSVSERAPLPPVHTYTYTCTRAYKRASGAANLGRRFSEVTGMKRRHMPSGCIGNNRAARARARRETERERARERERERIGRTRCGGMKSKGRGGRRVSGVSATPRGSPY